VRVAVAALLILAGCERTPPAPVSPGARLERAAVAAGLVPDAEHASIVGSWARDSDRMCVVPAGSTTRIGVVSDYGEGQGCAASGVVERDGARLKVRLGACGFDARFDGERIAFPAELPLACAAACTGRATLAAVEVERLSGSASEAATLRAPDGQLLCAG